MKTKIYCKTTDKAVQSYYLSVEGKDYFLCSAKYRVSNKEIFRNGISVNELFAYKNFHSTSVRNTVAKLLPCIRYIEKEYGFTVLRGSQRDLGYFAKRKKQEDRFLALAA